MMVKVLLTGFLTLIFNNNSGSGMQIPFALGIVTVRVVDLFVFKSPPPCCCVQCVRRGGGGGGGAACMSERIFESAVERFPRAHLQRQQREWRKNPITFVLSFVRFWIWWRGCGRGKGAGACACHREHLSSSCIQLEWELSFIFGLAFYVLDLCVGDSVC